MTKQKQNIVLIGYRGTGKTTIGKIFADKLKLKFISIDKLIYDETKMPIPEIVKIYGWTKFRKTESEIVEKISCFDNCVIDCGGGVVEHIENIKRLKENGKIVLFEADIKDIIERIKGDPGRPRLEQKVSFEDEIKQVMRKRKKVYRQSADYIINTSKENIDYAVNRLKHIFLSS